MNDRTAWLIQNKIMQAMCEREEAYLLRGKVQLDDAYLGGERNGGKAGRGSENKVPIVAVTWTPKTEPDLMRASLPARLGQEKPHETQAPQPRADHPQTADC